ncbi:MAG: ABC transporter ATP-binding protein [Patescibacteria group bacterium]
MNRKDEHYPLRLFLRDCWVYTQGYHKKLFFWLTVRGFSSAQKLLPPILIAKIVDGVTLSTPTTSFLLAGTLFLFLVNGLSQTFLRLKSKFYLGLLAEKIRLRARQLSIARLLDFDLSWHEEQSSGKKITIVLNGADSLRGLVRFLSSGGGGLDIFVDVVVVLIIFLGLDLRYFLLAILNAVFYLGFNQLVNKGLNQKRHLLNKQREKVLSKNFDYFSNIGLIKRLGIGQQVNKALFKKESDFSEKTIVTSRLGINKWIVIQSISQFFQILIIVLVVLDIIAGKISVGQFFIYTGYVGRLQSGLSGTANWIDMVIEMKLGFWRLIQLIASGKKETDIGDQVFPEPVKKISFDQLNFKYKKGHRGVIKNLNLLIDSGSRVGFVGQSGSGKSTLVKLLLRLYLPDTGRITINQVNLNQIKTDQIRRNISIVPQESEVFNLTFRENITIASEESRVNLRRYQRALEIAECGPILQKIKNNHRALLGEKGVRLSGGERQRLGIARAIYKNSPIIIFDESTSSLDSKTEEMILGNIEKHLKNKTIIWIAHRLSTLRLTDQIFVFDDGKVAEKGSFNKLIKKQGLFYQLWQLQQKTSF